MAHDVFISYSIKDRHLADALCHKLEEDSIRCWIAPRDISPGGSWAGEIADAIPKSKIMILVFSSNANASKQVLREVELAITNNLTVIPMKIEDVSPTGGMSYYLSTTHWIDAIGKKFDKRITSLSLKIQAMLGIDKKEEVAVEEIKPPITAVEKPKPGPVPMQSGPVPKQSEKKKRRFNAAWIYVPLIVLIVATGAYFGIKYWLPVINSSENSTPPVTSWNTMPNRTAPPSDDIHDEPYSWLELLKETQINKPEDYGYDPNKEVLIEDSNLKKAIIDNLNFTREKQIDDNVINIGDMFDLRYLFLIDNLKLDSGNSTEIVGSEAGLNTGDVLVSSPARITSLNGLQYAKNLIVFDLIGYPIEDLSALLNFESLRVMTLATERHFGQEYFQNLDNLLYLELHGLISQQTFNIVKGMNNLKELYINFEGGGEIEADTYWEETNSPIEDPLWLEDLNHLEALALNGLDILDISPVATLTNLHMLSLANNKINDVEAIGNLTNLTELMLYNNSIGDVSPLNRLNKLKWLNLEFNPVENIGELTTLDSLQELYIDMTVYNSNTDELYDLKTKGCVIYTREKHPAEYGFDPGMHVVLPYDIDQGIKSSLTSIEYEFQPELTIIDLFQIDNLIILRDGQDFDENATLCTDFKGTHFNYIYTNEPFDLNFLDYMRNLKILHISNYNQADILDVRNLENLQFISFPTNQITDLSPISNLKNLKGADFNGNKIEDVSPLMEIDSLTYLQLNGNNIADLSPFDGNLSQLDILMLSDNKISDISPLAGLRALRVLALNNNEITDLSPLLELEKLKNVEIDEWQAEQSQSAYNELLEKGVHVGVTIFE